MATTSKSRSSGTKKRAQTKKQKEAQQRAQRQMRAIILFATGLFTGALTIIQGTSVWNWLHSALFGLFGTCTVLATVLLIYIAVLQTMDKPTKVRAWQGSLLLVFFCGAMQIFQMGVPQSEGFFEMLVECVVMGMKLESGGLAGTIVGLPLLLMFGKIGAGFTIVLLICVFLMLVTGGTLIGIVRAANRPVRKLEETYAMQVERMEERIQQRKMRQIDIPMSEGDDTDIPVGEEPLVMKRRKSPPHKSKIDIPLDIPSSKTQDIGEDVPLEEDFQPEVPDTYSIDVPDEPMQFVKPPDPSLDELVSKAATETGKFDFDSAGMHVPAMLESPRQAETPPIQEPQPKPLSKEERGSPDEGIRSELEAGAAAPQPVYVKPPLSLLKPAPRKGAAGVTEEMKGNAQRLVDTLSSFGVQTRIVDISRGPAVTRYELQPSAGVKISKITNLADDIALNLATAGVRIEAPIPNKAAVGIEVPNKVVSAVSIREIIDSEENRKSASKLTVALGRDIAGNVTLADIAKMPHLLIAGSTGSGKSVCINSIIVSLLFKSTPEEVRFLMIDPKVVELGVYNGIPQLLVPVVTDPKKAAGALSWAVAEMLKRYKLFADNSVRDLTSYNQLAGRTDGMEKLPQIVIIIDELADLMMAAPNEIEDSICRLAQMARAAGMHLIIATQRPSVDVITGVIKANIPSRIAFAVSSQIDSRTILDMGGAEKLLGRGDMLFNPVGASKPIRVQGCFVTDEEIEKIIAHIKNDATADYDDSIAQVIDNHVVTNGKGSAGGSDKAASGDAEDEMLMPAIECVIESGQASTSLLQRRLKLGYARAARIVDELEARGIVGPFEGSKPRQVLISHERWMEMKMQQQAAQEQASGQ